eukprot:jgi/Ulvmu1/12246/UM086_0037.1
MEVSPLSVSLPAEFQRAVNQGTPHIIIQEHLDLTGLGAADGSSVLTELLVHQARTQSIRGNCTTSPPPKNLEPALAQLKERQCVIYIHHMLMRLPVEGNMNGAPPNNLLLDNLYIRILRASTQEAQRDFFPILQPTAIGLTLYMTRTTFQGDSGHARALDVRDGSLVYAEDCTFLDLFTADGPGIALVDGAVALRACTFERCRSIGGIIDVANERLRAEGVVFDSNGASRSVSVASSEGQVYADPLIQVYIKDVDATAPSLALTDVPPTFIFPDSSDTWYQETTQALGSYDLSVEGPRQPVASAGGPQAMPPAQAAAPADAAATTGTGVGSAAVPPPAAPAAASGESHVTLVVAVVLAALLAAAVTALAFFIARQRRSRKERHALKASVTELDDLSHENGSNGTHLPPSPPEAVAPSSRKVGRSRSRSGSRTATRSTQSTSSFGTATSQKPDADPLASAADPSDPTAPTIPSLQPTTAAAATAAGYSSHHPSASDGGTAAAGSLPGHSPWSSLSSNTNPANRAAAAAAVAAAAVAHHPAAMAATSPHRSTRASGTPTASAHGYAVAPVLAYSQATPPTSGHPPLSHGGGSYPSDPSRGDGRPLPVLTGSALAASATGNSSTNSWDLGATPAPHPVSPTERRAQIQQQPLPHLQARPPPTAPPGQRVPHHGMQPMPLHHPGPALHPPGALSLAELLPRFPPGTHPTSPESAGALALAGDPYARLAGGLHMLPGDALGAAVVPPLKAPIKPPPSPESHGHKHPLDVLEDALDWMAASGRPFLGQYTVLAAAERRRGGQGVVQFVRSRASGEEFAVKFYAARTSFERERALYMDASLRSMMPATRAFIGNYNGAVSGPNGYVFPPCIIIERGESLKEWAKREATDFITNMQVLIHLATRLRLLHAAGWVHRDIKPGNILRRPRQHSWTLIDFGSTVREGAAVGLSYSLAYAPPEVVNAIEAAAPTLVASAKVDMWALGVIAYELLTQHHPFPPKATRASVRAQIAGRDKLPWEREDDPQRARDMDMLRGLKRSVMLCLDRDPEKRPTAEKLLWRWNNMFDKITSELTATATAAAAGAVTVPTPVPSPAREAEEAAAAEVAASQAAGPAAVAADADAELAMAEAVARTAAGGVAAAAAPPLRPGASTLATVHAGGSASGTDDTAAGSSASQRPGPLAEMPSPRPQQGGSSGLAAASATVALLPRAAPEEAPQAGTPPTSVSPLVRPPIPEAEPASPPPSTPP